MIEQVFVFVFGSLVGSFLNVCIHRMPYNESVVMPRSHCPKCKKTIAWYDNIPFISYILLKGRCRNCKEKISFRYFIVEFITALLFLLLFRRFGISFEFFLFSVMSAGLIIATFVDFQLRIIPDEISMGGAVAGFIFNAARGLGFNPLSYDSKPLINSVLGIVIGGGIIFLTAFIFDLVYFRMMKKPPVDGETSSMGGGDVKLLAMIGAFLGWQQAILVFFLAPFFGIIIALANVIVKREHVIPYGPFLSLAAIISIFWGTAIINYLVWGMPR